MDNLQKYIKESLGIELRLKILSQKELDKLPLYLRRDLKVGEFLGREIIFANKSGLTPAQYKKQADIIEKNIQKPVAFIFDNIEPYNRKRLIKNKIAFIVPGRQMYLPYLLIDIKEYNKSYKKAEKLFPAAQCLLFYYLLGNEIKGTNFKSISGKLNYGTMTVTRAANILAEFKLCRIEGSKEKNLVFEKNNDLIWKDAQEYLINPIEKEMYTDDNCNFNFTYKAELNALAHYTEISEVNKNIYAVSFESLKLLRDEKKIKFVDSYTAATTLQVWKYDPGVLAKKNVVDPLSLYLTLKDDPDERTHGELKKLIDDLW